MICIDKVKGKKGKEKETEIFSETFQQQSPPVAQTMAWTETDLGSAERPRELKDRN